VSSTRDRFALSSLAVALLGCEAQVTTVGSWTGGLGTGFYIEAESGQLSAGFIVGNDASASGGSYIEAPAGSAPPDPEMNPTRATYSFSIATSGRYAIWGRIRSPDSVRNRFWIRVDDGIWTSWRIATGDIWYWNRFHENTNYNTPLTYDLQVGVHQLIVASEVEGVGLDRLYFSTNGGDTPLPRNDTPCRPPHTIQVGGKCIPSCGIQGGKSCDATMCMGRPILEAYDCSICCVVP